MLCLSPCAVQSMFCGKPIPRNAISETTGSLAKRWNAVGRKPSRGGPNTVFRITAPTIRPGRRKLAAAPMGPPQSWPTKMKRSSSSASTRRARCSAWLCSVCHEPLEGRSEKPRPTRSGITRRSFSPDRARATLRQRKLQVGLPCTSSTGSPSPCSIRCIRKAPTDTRARRNGGSCREMKSGSSGGGWWRELLICWRVVPAPGPSPLQAIAPRQAGRHGGRLRRGQGAHRVRLF